MNKTSQTQILRQIARIQRMEPGKLCITRRGPTRPYYNISSRERGKQLTAYVRGDQVKLVERHTANYRKFMALVAKYARIIIERTRARRIKALKRRQSARGASRIGAGKQNAGFVVPPWGTRRRR